MRIITRQVNEGIVIGDDIHVTVLDIHEDHVRLAISRPDSNPSYWEETVYWNQEAEVETLQYAE